MITYTITNSRLGYLLLAATQRGLCDIRFGNTKKDLECDLKKKFPGARGPAHHKNLRKWAYALKDYLEGRGSWPLLPYEVHEATAFQRKVWDWLRTIPVGKTYTYSQAARAINRPHAHRAVARACATNPVALVTPCHRIVPKSGGVGGYRWSPHRKRQLLKLEIS